MIRTKLLMIAPYPVANPQHGGQKRAKALLQFYKDHVQTVEFVGVYHRGHYKDWSEDDLQLGDPEIIHSVDLNPLKTEIIAGMALDKDTYVRSFMAKKLMEFKPDIIHIEQVFPYLGLKVLLLELGLRARVIFGSQNIEYILKQQILDSSSASDAEKKSIINQVKELETDFSAKADLVIAVSDQDAKVHKSMGAKICIVAPNGIEKSMPSQVANKYWQEFKKIHAIKNAIVFVGSAHPPNWLGFKKMLGDKFNFLPEGSKIILAGGIADYFEQQYDKGDPIWKKVIPVGKLDEDSLSGLLTTCDMLLLPITLGGGSNLKTAEAILSGKKTVATNYAFRGFEQYSTLPNIYLANNPKTFQETVARVIDMQYEIRNSSEVELANHVQWKYTLLPLLPMLKKLAHRTIKQRAKRVARRLLR